MRLFLNGDGDTRDKYLSLFFVIIKGGYDPILQWPFLYKVTFSLIDQSTLDNNQRNINKSFWPDPTLSCFKRPVYSMNEAYGIKKFFPIELLKRHRNLYIQDGVMFIKIVADFSAERPGKMRNLNVCLLFFV
jgi:TNF receptor-associated factor 4